MPWKATCPMKMGIPPNRWGKWDNLLCIQGFQYQYLKTGRLTDEDNDSQ